MSYLKAVESRIAEAMAAGAFRDLPGAGRPLDLSRGDLAGDLWLGHHILENEGLLPPWLQLARDIEQDLAALARLDERHAGLVDEAVASGDWDGLMPRIGSARDDYERLARSIRARQDQFNLDAPGRLSERPGIWVEYRLGLLDARVTGARGCSEPSR